MEVYRRKKVIGGKQVLVMERWFKSHVSVKRLKSGYREVSLAFTLITIILKTKTKWR